MNGHTGFSAFRDRGRTSLTECEAKDVLGQAGIRVVETKLARSKEEAVIISKQMGFPVVLKIASPDVIHKSDSGGVELGLDGEIEVTVAYESITSTVRQLNHTAHIEGVSVQSMARPGVEVIVGMSKDPQFGPVIMFGLGGVLVEILKDVSFRLVPLTERDAREMITEIKGYHLLEGYRGKESCDIHCLERLLLQVSDFVARNSEVKELDLNPVFAYGDGAVAVDARIMLEDRES